MKNGGCAVYHKTNRETMVEIGDSVRGKDIYIIQTGTKYVYIFVMYSEVQKMIFKKFSVLGNIFPSPSRILFMHVLINLFINAN